jgi:hypothetical protein
VISSFTASPNPAASGQAVMLSWTTNGAIYNLISPTAGPVRGNTFIVKPKATTTYTLYSTNQYGRTAATVTVTIQ